MLIVILILTALNLLIVFNTDTNAANAANSARQAHYIVSELQQKINQVECACNKYTINY